MLARAPDDRAAHPELARLLGAERYAAVQRILLGRVGEWARGVAPGAVYVAGAGAALLGGEVSELKAADGADGASVRLGRVAQRALEPRGAPLLVAWPGLLRWRAAHAAGALDDLADGCDVSVGPVFDGGLYLLALARAQPALWELPDDGWHAANASVQVLAAAQAAGLQTGLLRPERGLRTPADVRAALADPLLDEELAAVLAVA